LRYSPPASVTATGVGCRCVIVIVVDLIDESVADIFRHALDVDGVV
jgi:hypothetical protein